MTLELVRRGYTEEQIGEDLERQSAARVGRGRESRLVSAERKKSMTKCPGCGPGLAPRRYFFSVAPVSRRDRAQRRLRGVEAEPEILVVVGGEHVGRLVPLRIPAAADLHAALVFAQADRGDDVHERTRIRVGHVRPDRRRIVGRVLLVRRLEDPRQLLRFGGHLRVRLELDVDVGFGRAAPGCIVPSARGMP